ncbi:IS91 family transposase [Enterocloster clostridioformis]|uniref:Transposase n=1 Tax=Enterocloster clostridioformis TaxID=1531 RepID=A0A2X2UFF3_9FIRM|nr:transposase [Enterocloster clostridioformis]MCA5578560.1 transposase [Enterocloster clostridioformis]SQB11673.1 Putative transposase [Enterocloster clostridioformis]
MHCIVSGGGLTPDHKIRKAKDRFFIPVKVLRDKFKGKYLACLDSLYKNGRLNVSSSCEKLRNSYEWSAFRDALYEKDWCPYIKETFNGFGNAIEYLGRYTHKIAISYSRILSVDEKQVSFSARGKKPGGPRRTITLENTEFIRRYLMHVLPSGFQKIRYYGFLNNRGKSKNLKLIFTLQGHQRFRARYSNLSMAELVKEVWKFDIRVCPECGCCRMQSLGRLHGTS